MAALTIIGALFLGCQGIWRSSIATDWKIIGVIFLVGGFPALVALSRFPVTVTGSEKLALFGAFLLFALSIALRWASSNTMLMYKLVVAVIIVDLVGIAAAIPKRKF